MKSHLHRFVSKFTIIGALSLLYAGVAGAQTYYSTTNGDLVAGFRKTGTFIENNELIVTLGNIVNLLKLSVGTTINVSNYSTVQITNMCPDNLANLQWSVFGAIGRQPGLHENPWVTSLGSFPAATIWETVPRTDVNTPTTSPMRYSSASQGNLRQKILSVSVGGNQISSALNTTNRFNNFLLVTEPTTYDVNQNTISALIADPQDPTVGDFGAFTFNIENTTPDPFTSIQRSDLYQFCPTGAIDPITGQTNGPAYYVGYLTLNSDGTMSFTRATQSTVSNPPPPPVLTIATSITQGGGGAQVNSTISFNTTNGATYTLYYTNSTGLKTSRTTWPSLGSTITGDGSMHSFTNSSTDPNRFYSVGAQ